MLYFLNMKIVSRLIDLITRYVDSNYAYEKPPFTPVVELISYLVRHQPVYLYKYKLGEQNQDHQNKPNEILQFLHYNRQYYSPFCLGDIYQDQDFIFLDNEDWYSLFLEHRRKRDWLKIFLKGSYNGRELGLMLGHLCWCNFDLSRRVAKCLIVGLNKINKQELE